MKLANLLLALSLSAPAAGCVNGPGKGPKFATPVSAVAKKQAKLAPDIQKILAAGGLDPANPSAPSAQESVKSRAVALALAHTTAPEPVKTTRTITLSTPTQAKPAQALAPTRSVKKTPPRTRVATTLEPAKRSVTRF
ncbi:hypothetical protein [Roseibium sp. RKSG952]|uniref:hypothetical protein n=1 Tax=Roseibium sp. RKSG952 TaxID=2529384 RepID=UPI0012BC480F|nr:hypothetical protein [Roseibium sp. RKSG952]MTH94659.1 hypothetical protein [Roseibium sp. RKSG952]